jgi:hypothetical protein
MRLGGSRFLFVICQHRLYWGEETCGGGLHQES